MLVLRNMYELYFHWFHEDLDPRTKDLFLLGSPWPVLTILSVYLYIVNGNGQRWMKDRNAFDLTRIINFYNLFQMAANFYCFSMAVYHPWKQDNFRLFCIPEGRNDPSALGTKIVLTSYFFFLLKVLDLVETIFFILRKKDNQVTFLHVYHHAGVMFGGYVYLKLYSGGGYATVFGLLNSFVHVIMYGYYFTTSYKPELKKSIWWKRHITEAQLIQFIILFLHCGISLFARNCNNSKVFLWIGVAQAVIMLALFGDFYYKAYIKKKPKV